MVSKVAHPTSERVCGHRCATGSQPELHKPPLLDRLVLAQKALQGAVCVANRGTFFYKVLTNQPIYNSPLSVIAEFFEEQDRLPVATHSSQEGCQCRTRQNYK